MAPLWDMLGMAASVMQVTGVDALGMVSMIVQAARTARRNRDLCQQLAKKVEIVSDLLEDLHIPELRRHRKTRRPLDELRSALFRGYVLVWSCSHQQNGASQFWQMFVADDMAAMLRQAKDEIDSYIFLVPMITAVASIRAQDSETNEAAPTRSRPQLTIQEVAHSPSSSSSQEVPHLLELEENLSRPNGVFSGNNEPSQTSSQSSHAPASNWEQERLSELVSMMVCSADTARHNRDPCKQLARQAVIVSNQVQGPLGAQRLRLEQLEDVLFRGYMLICFCSQYSTSQLQLVFTGADVASVFQLAQQEIGRHIYHLTSRVPAEQREVVDEALIQELPKFRLKADPTDYGLCSICIGVFHVGNEVRRLPCAHNFHVECIDMWLRLTVDCPLCRCSVFPNLDLRALNNIRSTPLQVVGRAREEGEGWIAARFRSLAPLFSS